MSQHTPVPTRRTVIAGALGAGALGGFALTSGPASAALGEPTIPSEPAISFYLNLATIPGSSQNEEFVNQIEVITWGWGVDSTSTILGGGGGSGKATPQDFVFLAQSGIQSPKILTAVNTGKRLQSAVLSCVRPGDGQFTFMTLRFEEVLPTNYYVTPDATTGVPLDLVHLKFGRITQKVFTQNPDGTLGTAITSTFDYRTNRA